MSVVHDDQVRFILFALRDATINNYCAEVVHLVNLTTSAPNRYGSCGLKTLNRIGKHIAFGPHSFRDTATVSECPHTNRPGDNPSSASVNPNGRCSCGRGTIHELYTALHPVRPKITHIILLFVFAKSRQSSDDERAL